MDLDMNFEMDFKELEKKLPEVTKKNTKSYEDNRFWKLGRDENNSGGAIIRLLWDKNETPFVAMFQHSIQTFNTDTKKKMYYIEWSPQTIKKDCPATKLFFALRNAGYDDASKFFTRKVRYFTNILVQTDPANKDNEGKVFLWEFGNKLQERFKEEMNPPESAIAMGEKPKFLYNPLEKGSSIKLKIKKQAGFFNYDSTEISLPVSAFESVEDAVRCIKEDTYDLSEFQDEKYFKEYDKLYERFKKACQYYQPIGLSKDEFADIWFETFEDTLYNKKKQATKTVSDQTLKDEFKTNETKDNEPDPFSETDKIDWNKEGEINPSEIVEKLQNKDTKDTKDKEEFWDEAF